MKCLPRCGEPGGSLIQLRAQYNHGGAAASVNPRAAGVWLLLARRRSMAREAASTEVLENQVTAATEILMLGMAGEGATARGKSRP